MGRRRSNRRSHFQVALTQVHGIGLHSLAELPRHNRSGGVRWWRGQTPLAKLAFALLFACGGLGLGTLGLLALGAALIH